MRVLAIAYACDPEQGSEEGVGWGWVRMLAASNDMDVITAEHNLAAIDRWARKTKRPFGSRVRFHAVPHKLWHYRPTPFWQRIENSPLKPVMNIAYQSWLRSASELAAELHSRNHYDLVHLLTYVGFRFPGRFYQLDIPFVWGPVGGMENTPWRFLTQMGARGAVYYACRNLINSMQKRLLPGPRRAFAKAAATGGIIAATESNRRQIERSYGHDAHVICEIGPPPEQAGDVPLRHPGEPLRIAWSGQHLPGKALPLLLQALARVGDGVDWRLMVLGAGPMTRRWQRIAGRLGVSARCDWTGALPRAQALRRMRDTHLFAITSLKDLTSTVLLEALSRGVPVVCPDHCGFSDVVTESCGVKLALDSPRQFIYDLAKTIASLAHDEHQRRQLASGAVERSQEFTWERKLQKIDGIYRHAVVQWTRQVMNVACRQDELKASRAWT